MKTALITTGLGGIITAAAAAGPFVLTGFGVLVLVLIGAACWIITSPDRTTNAAAILTAARGQPPDPIRPAEIAQSNQARPGRRRCRPATDGAADRGTAPRAPTLTLGSHYDDDRNGQLAGAVLAAVARFVARTRAI